MKPLHEAIRGLRAEAGLSQERFAHSVGVSRLTVAAWERGTEPDLANLRKLVKEHGLDKRYLLGDAA